MFAEFHVIQFTQHSLITKIEGYSAQTAASAVSFVTEEYESTNCLYPSLQLRTLFITLTHKAI